MSFVKEDGANTTSGKVIASDKTIGYNLDVHHAGNPSAGASLTAQHIRDYGNQVSAATSIGAGSATHRVDVQTFATHTMPKAQQNFTTVGARIDAQMGPAGANAAIAHTPAFRQTDQSVGASINLHRTPTSSIDVGLEANRTVTPNYRGNWNNQAVFRARKDF